MNRLRTSFAVFLLAGLLLIGAIAGSDNETTNAELVATIHLYRTEGAEASLPDFERLLAEFKASGWIHDLLETSRTDPEALHYTGKSLGERPFQARDFALNIASVLGAFPAASPRLGALLATPIIVSGLLFLVRLRQRDSLDWAFALAAGCGLASLVAFGLTDRRYLLPCTPFLLLETDRFVKSPDLLCFDICFKILKGE